MSQLFEPQVNNTQFRHSVEYFSFFTGLFGVQCLYYADSKRDTKCTF